MCRTPPNHHDRNALLPQRVVQRGAEHGLCELGPDGHGHGEVSAYVSGSVPVESGDGGDCLSDGSAAGDSFAGGGAVRVVLGLGGYAGVLKLWVVLGFGAWS